MPGGSGRPPNLMHSDLPKSSRRGPGVPSALATPQLGGRQAVTVNVTDRWPSVLTVWLLDGRRHQDAEAQGQH